MAKMGRPKSDDPMNYRFTIRFSNAEQKQLEAYAETDEAEETEEVSEDTFKEVAE